MKKLLILSLIAFFALGSAKVFAQGTGAAPYAGSTHTYYVNGSWTDSNGNGIIDGTETLNNTASADTYTWWVATDPNNLADNTTAASISDGYFTAPYGTYNGTGSNDNYISLTWTSKAVAAAAASTQFFIVVQEEDANGCSNLKAYPVTPTNGFQLAFDDVKVDPTDGSYTVVADNNTNCAADVTAKYVTDHIEYTYGKTVVVYKLKATGIANTAWSFDFNYSNTNVGGANVTAEYGTSSNGKESGFTSVGTITPGTPVDVASGTNEIFVKVTVDNQTATGSNTNQSGYNDGTTEQDIVMTISNVIDADNNAVKDINGSGQTDDSRTQIINARPSTSDIQSN